MHTNSKFSSSWYGNDNVVPKSYEDIYINKTGELK